MSTGAIIAVSGIIMHQISAEWLVSDNGIYWVKNIILKMKSINGQVYWGIGMGASSIIYIVVSLLGTPNEFELDNLLQRGKYINKDETHIVNKNPEKGWKILGMGKEFTKFDKFIFIINYLWTFGWTIVFIIGTIYNLSNDVSDTVWMNFWWIYLLIHILLAIVSIVWFTIGGFIDLKNMMDHLKYSERDHSDDGFVLR